MKTTINYLKQDFSLYGVQDNIHNVPVKKIVVTYPDSNSTSATIWNNGKDKGVWLNTHNSSKHPMSKQELFFLHEIMIRFTYYWNKLK